MTGGARERMLTLIKARGPQTAAALAESLDFTSVAARQHLAKLEAAGLVSPEDRRESVGRPRRYWHLTDKAETRFPDSHAFLTLELLAGLKQLHGEAGLEALISHREEASRKSYEAALSGAGGLEEKLLRLAKLRTREGYMAELEALGDGSFRLLENHCPICAAARECQGFCRSELALFQAVLGPRVKIEREEHILAGARRCSYRIILVENQ